MRPVLLPHGEPFFFVGNTTACLLIHGFTATPREMRGLGEYLFRKRGYTALGVRLAGHATTPADMAHMRWEDWVASAEDGWHLLRSMGFEDIVVVGLSMGGAIALLLSSYLPVKGVVSMAAPYDIHIPWQDRILAIFRPFFPKEEGRVFDPRGFEGRLAYAVNPARSALELDLMLHEMRKALPEVKMPALVLHSRNDAYVLPHNAEQIFASLGSEQKQLVWVERSSHVVTLDAERGRVYREVGDFVRHVVAEAQAT